MKNKASTPENVTKEQETDLAISETKATQVLEVSEISAVNKKTTNAVFERLDEGIKMREHYNKSKNKLEEFENFVKNHEDEGLTMEITNVATNDVIQFQSVPMIKDFLANVVAKGKQHLKEMEKQIENFTI